MADRPELNDPWMVAVWPGMGHVAMNAGYYLMAKLGMRLELELPAEGHFEIEQVEVKNGIIRPSHLPRSRFFLWRDPRGERDLVVFQGEAQPPTAVRAYCSRLIDHADELGVKRVFTFAAMATQMAHEDPSRVFGAATDEEGLAECREHDLEILRSGQISGLNGVLLGVAAERGLRGTCLLGEIPQMLAQMPYPKASLAVLEIFRTMVGLNIDLTELARETESVDEQLQTLVSRINEAIRQQQGDTPESFGVPTEPEEEETDRLSADDRKRIEELFGEAERDRSQAYRLKKELDRLEAFGEYEDRFLDLFRGSGDGEE